jgi:hypothetical protein
MTVRRNILVDKEEEIGGKFPPTATSGQLAVFLLDISVFFIIKNHPHTQTHISLINHPHDQIFAKRFILYI